MKENNEKKENQVVVIPQNYRCSGRTCGDCIFMDLSDSDQYGHYYCGKKRKYYPAGDTICGEYQD